MLMSRRDMLAGGVVGTAFGGGSVDGEPAGQKSDEDAEVAKSLRRIAYELESGRTAAAPGEMPAIVSVRENMLQFLKSTNRWPDFIDVGPRIWFRAYDWHVRFGQQPVITRLPDGHSGLTFMFTTLVLRQEQAADYIGVAYDKDRAD